MASSTHAMSSYLQTKLLNHILRNIPYTMPTTFHLTVYTQDTNGNIIEITPGDQPGTSEDRIPYVMKTSFDISANSCINKYTDNFWVSGVLWQYWQMGVYYWGLEDAYANSNSLFVGTTNISPTIVQRNYTCKVSAGDIIISFANIDTSHGGWTYFSALEMAKWVVSGSVAFDWATNGTYLALGNSVITNTLIPGANLFESFIEINASDYSRIKINTTDWDINYSNPNISTGACYNIGDIIFSDHVSEDWGIISDIVLFDGLDTNANPIFWGHLEDPVNLLSGNGFKIPAGNLQVYFYG